MNNTIRTNKTRRKITTKALLAGATLLIGVPAIGFGGGAPTLIGHIGELPADWFADEVCRTEPITIIDDPSIFAVEYQFDVEGVANDGDPNTYIRCILKANDDETTCLAGLPDGTVVGCSDQTGPETLPRAGDIVYMQFDSEIHSICNVFIGTHDQWGEADPKCRTSGGDGDGGDGDGGDGDSGSVLGCNPANSTAVVGNSTTALTADACYSFHKETGTQRFGNWESGTFNIEIEDSAMNLISASIGEGGWSEVNGVANGTIFFKVDSNVTIQAGAW